VEPPRPLLPRRWSRRSQVALRRRSWAWRYRRLLFLVGLVLFTSGAGALFLLTRVPLPEPDRLPETTILTDVNGVRLASIDSGEDRIPVPLSEVPVVVRQAVIATEDRDFFSHGGLDPIGIVRATIADVRGKHLQGGSTITQQYVKQVYLDPHRTLTRKLREAALAIKVERRYPKEDILERYLNTVYLGRGAYGVQAAARAYFGKDVGRLGLAEAAYLAGLIRAPVSADASLAPRAAAARRDRSLRLMREAGVITRAQERAAARRPITAQVLGRDEREPQIAGRGTGYFADHVRRELLRRYGEDTTYQGGLRVRTSIDLRLQEQAYDAVYGLLDQPDSDPAGALVAVDGDGRVVAMVGGRDFATSKVNVAVGRDGGGSGRQAGSTFKPFLLAAAVKDGYSVQSAFPAPAQVVLSKADEGRDYPVDNYDGEDYGPSLGLVDATASSVNTVFVQAQESLGRQKVVDMAKAMGVRSDVEAIPSLVLGTEEVSVLEMAGAYSTLANRGVHVEPRFILEVRTADGTVLQRERPAPRERVLSTAEADVVNHCLRQVVLRGSGQGAKLSTAPVAGKTGTTQNYGDAWFIGYTPKLTAAVWMGFPDGNEHTMQHVRGRKVTGGSFPATIFRRFMAKATEDARYRGEFTPVTRFRGRTLPPPSDKKVVIPAAPTSTTGTSTTTTVPG
jgi:penicillin-binding protein 1A